MKVGIPIEVNPQELRVAATPKTVQRLIKQGFEVFIQKGALNGSGLRQQDTACEYECYSKHQISDTVYSVFSSFHISWKL